MNKEEIDKWLYEKYGCSYTRLEELHDFYFEKYTDLKEENNQLKEELKAVNKGLRKVLSKRKKWKYRYYKEKMKNRKAIKYIEDKIQKSFKADYGLEPFERTDRLFTETVFELQKIEQILDKGVDK